MGPSEDPPCQQNNTASVTFENRSNSSTYDVIWDGSRIGSIGPGASISRTVAAGQHTLVFKFSNTSNNACSQSTPNPAQCSSQTYSCGADLP